MILTLLLPYFIIYHVLKYPSNKFQEENLSNSKSFDIEDKFSTEEIANIIEKIENYFRLKKPYLDPNLTINKLSTEIKISPRYLSNIINQRIGKSFYDLINSYRVKEAEKLLAEDQNCSVLEICYKVGFNSKSAFNTAFKKYSGITPSSFKKNL
jgi:AraC-like DNA-binding protein